MRSKNAFSKKDAIVVLMCVVFLLVNFAAIGIGGRKRAKDILCLSNLRQWGVAFQAYTQDHNGSFMTGKDLDAYRGNGGPYFPGSGGFWWMVPLRPYYGDHNMRICPTTNIEGKGPFSLRQGVEVRIPQLLEEEPDRQYWQLSYAPNIWIMNPVPNATTILMRQPVENCWRTPDVQGASQIPIFMDCTSISAAPSHNDQPPTREDDFLYTTSVDNMKPFCVNRHTECTQGLFMDFSARKVGLKELWELKWHRNWNPNNDPPPVWPAWMENMKDYAVEEDEGEGAGR